MLTEAQAYLRAIIVFSFCLVLLVFSFVSYSRFNKREKSLLIRRLADTVEKLKILNRNNELIMSSVGLSDVINLIIEDVTKLVKGTCVLVFLLNEEKNEMALSVISRNCKPDIKDLKISNAKTPGIFNKILNKKTIEIEKENPELKINGGIIFPILCKEEVIGALFIIDTTEERKLNQEEINCLRTFASQISIICENKRFLELEKIYKEEIMGINAITEVGLLSLTLDEVLEVLINRFVSIARAESGAIFLKSVKSDEYLTKSMCGFKFKRAEIIMEENNDIIEETVKTGKTVISNNRISIPLKINNIIIGSMIFYKEKFGEREKKHLENLVEKASIVIERARVYESTMSVVNDLSSISYLGNVILSTLDLDNVLNLIVRSISEMMEAKGTILRLINDSKKELELFASYGLSSKFLSIGNLNIETSTEGEVVRTHQILAIEDITKYKYEYDNESKTEGIKALACVPLMTKNKVVGILTVYFSAKRIFHENDKKLISVFASQIAIAIENAKLFKNWKDMYLNVIKSFATAIDAKDKFTRGHSEEVTRYAIEIAVEMGLSEDELELLQYSAILHDIGKIGIEDNILKKPAKLTKEEYEVIKTHPSIASKILENIGEFKEISNIIAHHHEHYNGKGYPDGLKEVNIPLLSRIISVVDAFEAMTSDRPYRKAMNMESALKELEVNKSTQFDPAIVDTFKKVLGKKADKNGSDKQDK